MGLLLLLLAFMLSVRPAFGDVFYAYDELGRLIAVVDSNGAGARYAYDAVGNILAITRFTTAAPPTLGAIVPAQGEAGSTFVLNVSGENLAVLDRVISDNPGVTLLGSAVTAIAPDQLTLYVRVAADAPLGVTRFTAATPFGSSAIDFTLIQPPVILTRLFPDIGDVGTQVTIQGSGLISAAGATSVTFAGPSFTRIPATLVAPPTATQLIVEAPAGFVTGPVEVAVGPKLSNELFFTFIGDAGS